MFTTYGPADKIRLVLRADALDGDRLGVFLRQRAIHRADLEFKPAERQIKGVVRRVRRLALESVGEP